MLVEDAGLVDAILSSWNSILPATLHRWQVDEAELRKTWGTFRDRCGSGTEACTCDRG